MSGLEEAMGSMSKGERSLFVIPVSKMRCPASAAAASPSKVFRKGKGGGEKGVSSGVAGGKGLMPDPPSTAFQVEVELELLDLIQV